MKLLEKPSEIEEKLQQISIKTDKELINIKQQIFKQIDSVQICPEKYDDLESFKEIAKSFIDDYLLSDTTKEKILEQQRQRQKQRDYIISLQYKCFFCGLQDETSLLSSLEDHGCKHKICTKCFLKIVDSYKAFYQNELYCPYCQKLFMIIPRTFFFKYIQIDLESKIINNIFKDYNQLDFVIDNYNQFIQYFYMIIDKFQFNYVYKNVHGENIQISYFIKNPSDQNILTNPDYLKECYRCQERIGLDFQITFQFNLQFVFTNLDNGIQFIHPKKCLFNLMIPIMTGTYVDPINYMTKRQIWDEGLDLNHSGGDIILSGVKYLLPNIYSYPPNKPVVTHANVSYNKQVVRCEFIKQMDPMFGNTYHISYVITENVISKGFTTNDIVVNIYEKHDSRFISQSTTALKYVPISLLFYAYGVSSDAEILSLCNPNNSEQLNMFLINVFRNGYYTREYRNHYNQESAKQEIAKILLHEQFYNNIDDILEKYVNPLNQKFLLQLGQIVNKMFRVFTKQIPEDDKQDLTNKRVMTVASQVVGEIRSKLYENFRQQMKSLSNTIINESFQNIVLQNGQNIAKNIISSLDILQSLFEKSIKRSFTSVNSTNQSSNLKKVQNDQKSKELEVLQKREIVIRPQFQNVKVDYNKRKVQMSFYGFIDPIQTPEAGSDIGRYLSPNIYTYVTKCGNHQKVLNFLEQCPLVEHIFNKNYASVKVNYNIIGFVKYENFFKLYKELMTWRQQNLFLPDRIGCKLTDTADQLFTSVFYNIEDQYIGINTDTGRLMTPIITPNLKDVNDLYNMSLHNLLQSEKIIFICPDMINNFIVKEWQFLQEDHVQNIYHFLPFGLSAGFNSINPFSGYMKSIRSALFTSQGKQSIQQPISNHMSDCSGTQLISHQLQYGPIDTPVSRSLYRSFPIGNLVYTMFAQYVYNQEDAFIVNTGYLYRNGLSSSEYKVYSSTTVNNQQYFGQYDKGLDKECNRHVINKYNMISEIGTNVKVDDTLVWKIIFLEDQNKNRTITDKDKLVYINNSDSKYSTLSNVMNSSLQEGVNTKLVRIQLARRPIIGDKIITKNCQKGTIGKLLLEYQFPISESGIVPNFIVSCPSILKRETYGQLIEPLYNKKLILENNYIADVGNDKRIQNISSLQEIQNEIVYQRNGSRISEKILCGPMLFSSQCHLVSNKIRACDETQIDQMTRQPSAGKKNGGAMRYGVLEQTSLEAQGISNTLVNQSGQNSSNIRWYFCKQCNCDQVYFNVVMQKYVCPKCGVLSSENVGLGSLNYGEQLMSNILYSMGLGVKVYQ